MDGSLAGTPTRDDLRALSRRSDAAGALQLGLHATTIAATATGIALAAGSWWLVPAMAVHGAALVFLFAPLHETIHRTAFRSRRANLVVAWICGASHRLSVRFPRTVVAVFAVATVVALVGVWLIQV